MHKVRFRLSNDIRAYKELHRRLSARFTRISTGPHPEHLTITTKNGKKYYSETWVEEDVKKSKYLGTAENRDVILIQEKHYIIKALKVLEDRINGLEKALDGLKPFNIFDINNSLPKAYQLADDEVCRIIGPDDGQRWYADALERKAEFERKYGKRYQYNLTKTAKDGTRMRSKSEVIIANELINRGIPYIYEMPTFLKNNTLRPDFTFYSYSRCRPVMWEHAGMMGDEKYRKDFSDRLDKFIRSGCVPCVDIILTFDTVDGNIDTRMINDVIDEYI